MRVAGQRPGGRSARVRADVHRAVAELIATGDQELGIAEIARRAGVNPTSIYRRWGSLECLLVDAAAGSFTADARHPDTGTLRGDLLEFARQWDECLATPAGLSFLRALLGAAGDTEAELRAEYLAEQDADLLRILGRAAERGESGPALDQVFERVLAPLYLRALVDAPRPGYGQDLMASLLDT